jgi:hypothetical protein
MNAFRVEYNSHSPVARACKSYITMQYLSHTNVHELACILIHETWNILKHTSRHKKHAMSSLFYHFMIMNLLFTCSCHLYTWVDYLKLMRHILTTALFLCFILQKKSHEDGILLFYQPDIHICGECILLFLRNIFKFLGNNQFLEVCTTSKEIMLFHDNGFVLLRFANGFNQ